LSPHGNVRRFSVSLPPTLVEEFDETWQNMRYNNRSKAIHDAIRSFISEVKWMQNESDIGVGMIIILRYLNRPSVVEEVTAGQQEFKGIIKSIHQRYFEENKMLEIIEVEGKVGEIKQLTQEIMAKKGVKQVKASIIAP
jgi:CopG family nickel-responsive transcriptional regulator